MRKYILTITVVLACGLLAFMPWSDAQSQSDASASTTEAGLPVGVPVGTIVAWMKGAPGTPSLPREWVECNGQILVMPASTYNAQRMPNLNGANDETPRFLRGATQSGAVGGADVHVHAPFLIDRGGRRVINISSKAPASNLPPYYSVTWIMKVL